jgi:hypothetical protein
MNSTSMARAWANQQRTQKRELVLSPNRGSAADIQRYTFGVSADLIIGTPSSFNIEGRPETNLRPQRVTTNAVGPGFCVLTAIRVANVGVIVGGQIDAFDLAAQAAQSHLDVPTLTPANSVKVSGSYSGIIVLPTYEEDAPYTFTVSFKGPASMTP